MSANATGTPTSLGIPTFNGAQDVAGPDGVNEMMAEINTLIGQRMFAPSNPQDTQVVKWSQSGNAWVAGYVSPGELSQDGATTGQVLVWNGTAWAPGNAMTSYRKSTSTAVNTTTAATDLLGGAFTIGANKFVAGNKLQADVWGDFLQQSGSASYIPRFQLVVGGTTLLDTGVIPQADISSGATRFKWHADIRALGLGTASQEWWMRLSFGGATGLWAGWAVSTAFTTGQGEYAVPLNNTGTNGTTYGPGNPVAEGTASSTIDMTANRAFVLNVINGVSNASYETKCIGAAIDII